MVNVLVYILSDDPNGARIHRLKKLFSHQMFMVNILSPICQESKSDLDCEYNRCVSALKDSYSNSCTDYTIVIKDSSISLVTPDLMADIITTTINSGDFDICYLCKWADRCDLYTNKIPIDNTSAMIVKTQFPSGVQALLFSPNGRDIILGTKPMKNGATFEMKKKSNLGHNLNQEILKNNINAICLVPNLISYDVTDAKSNDDYKKTIECDTPNNGNSSGTQQSAGWLWTILVIIILIIIIWGIYKLRNNYKTY